MHSGCAGNVRRGGTAPTHEGTAARTGDRRLRWAVDFLDTLREQRTVLGRTVLTPALRQRLDPRLAPRPAPAFALRLRRHAGAHPAHSGSGRSDTGIREIVQPVGSRGRRGDRQRPTARVLEAWLGDQEISLVAEHGVWVCGARGKEWVRTMVLSDQWKSAIRDLMELHVHRLPGSFIEEKEFTLGLDITGARSRNWRPGGRKNSTIT